VIWGTQGIRTAALQISWRADCQGLDRLGGAGKRGVLASSAMSSKLDASGDVVGYTVASGMGEEGQAADAPRARASARARHISNK
jgi:hypothetical protein